MVRTPILLLTACFLLGSAPAHAEVPVKDRVFDPSCVSRIDVTAPAQSIANLYADPKGAYQPVDAMTFDLCGAGQEVFGPLNVTMRLKGSGSFRTLDGKAAFKIKMPSGNRIDGLKSLTLNNMVQDPSAVHEVLAYDAFRAVGVKAVRVGYATVTINGASYGLHANVETPDDRFLGANFDSTQHLYEAPDWTKGFLSLLSRDVVPGSVANFQVDEGDDDSIADLEALAAISELGNNDDWWAAFQQSFVVEDVLKFWATDLYLGNYDGYAFFTNNYYLHSTAGGLFRFLPWGTDTAFTVDLPLDPDFGNGIVFTRCMTHPPCRAAYRDALDEVAEGIIALDLVGKAHQLHATIADALAEDPRKEMSVLEHCQAVDATIAFLIEREALWSSTFRAPGAGISSAQSSSRLDCSNPETAGPETAGPETAGPEPLPATPFAGGGVTINDGARFTKSHRVTLTFAWPPDASSVEISNEAGFETRRTFSPTPSVRWTLARTNRSRRSRTVFVRFVGRNEFRSELASDEIVLDDTTPTVNGITVRALAKIPELVPSAQSRDRRPYRLTVAAKDSGSGVDTVQIQTFRNHKTIIKPYASSNRIKLSTAARHIRLRVVDRAGNASKWKTVSIAR